METANEKPTSGKLTSYATDFMLKEYDRIHELWQNETAQSEQRVNLFLTRVK